MSRWAGTFAAGVLGAVIFESWGLWGILTVMVIAACLMAIGAGLMELHRQDQEEKE